MKILSINAYIQRGFGKVLLDEKEVMCVSLDTTCTFQDSGVPDKELTQEEIDDLFRQCLSITSPYPTRYDTYLVQQSETRQRTPQEEQDVNALKRGIHDLPG